MDVKADHTAAGGVWHQEYQQWEWRDHLGLLHRVGDPAVMGKLLGRQEWWWRGRRHRDDGPAVLYANGSSAWWLHGEWHRIDGPAWIDTNGSSGWYVQGREITREVKSWMQEHNITWPFTPEQLMEFQLRWG